MEENLSAVIQTAKRLALLAEILERRSSEAISAQQRSAATLEQTASGVRNDAARILENGRIELAESAHHALQTHLSHHGEKLGQDISSATQRVSSAAQALEGSVERAGIAMGRMLKLGMTWTALACGVLITTGVVFIASEWRAYSAAKVRADAARIDADLAEAYARAGMTSCGGKPCVRLDFKAPRWGTKGEYVLVRTEGSN